MIKNYSTYIFDVGGTLIQFDNAKRALVYAERAAQVGVETTPAHARAVLDALDLEIPARVKDRPLSLEPERGRAFWLDLWAEGFRRLGVPEAESRRLADELLDQYNGADSQAVFDDVVPALDALHARGAGLGIISNFSSNCEALLTDLKLHDYFDFFVISELAGVEKPDARIFALAIAAARKPKSELMYVGDSIFHDVRGAEAAGLEAILLDRANRYTDFPGPRITSLLQLVH